MMRKTAAILFSFVGFIVFSCGQKQQSGGQAQEALLIQASGTVEVAAPDAWRKAAAGDRLSQGMKVRTGAGSFCDIRTGTENLVRLKANSLLELSTLIKDETKQSENTVLGLEIGTLLAKPKKLLKDSSFEVETPTAVAGVRGTEFLVSADAKQDTTVAVQEGSVVLTPKITAPAGTDKETTEALQAVVDGNAKVLTAGQQVILREETVRKLDSEIAKIAQTGDGVRKADEMIKNGIDAVKVTPVVPVLKKEMSEIGRIMQAPAPVPEKTADAGQSPAAARTYAEAWRLQADSAFASSGALAGGLTVFASKDGTVVAVSAAGAKKWSFETGSSIDSSPSFSAGKVLVAAGDENLYCLSAADGGKLWSARVGRASYGKPVVSGGTVLVGSVTGQLTALDLASGSRLWQFACQSGIYSSACVDGEKVFVGSEDNNLYCLDLQSGKKIWSFKADNRIVSSSPVAVLGLVVVGCFDGNLYAVSASSGKEVWRLPMGDKILASAAVSGSSLFIGANNGRFVSCDAATGKVLWQKELGSAVDSAAAVLPGGKLAVGTKDGSLLVLSSSTGGTLWKGSFGSKISGQPVLAAGNAVFATADGKVHGVLVTW